MTKKRYDKKIFQALMFEFYREIKVFDMNDIGTDSLLDVLRLDYYNYLSSPEVDHITSFANLKKEKRKFYSIIES